MSEFSGSKGVIIDGREQDGRTRMGEDGSYDALDLQDVRPHEVVTIVTDHRVQEFVKGEAGEHESVLNNWMLGPTAVRLALSEPTGKGTDFIHHGVVVKKGLGLQVSYPESNHPNVTYGLGVIVDITKSSSRTWDERGRRAAAGLEN